MTKPMATALKVEPLVAGAVEVVVKSHGAELQPFRVLLAMFGKEAAGDVQLLRSALTIRSSRLTQSALERGWQAAARLAERLRSVPTGPERTIIEHELEQSLQSLLSRDGDFIKYYVESLEEIILAGIRRKEARALKALGTRVPPAPAADVMARLGKKLLTAEPGLIQLWEEIFAIKQAHAGIERAAGIAAQRAVSINRLLRQGSSADRNAQLWGHLVKVRGELGEALALHSPAWLARLDRELARARRLAYRLGPGHQAVHVTQAQFGLQLNRAEGPDALVAIINLRERRIFDVARTQVKVALASENAAQNVNDVLRRVGLERDRMLAVPSYTFPLQPGGPPVVFAAASHPDVTTRLYLMNAAGGRMPAKDVELLRSVIPGAEEIGMGWTVNQLTHAAISLCESAVSLLKSS